MNQNKDLPGNPKTQKPERKVMSKRRRFSRNREAIPVLFVFSKHSLFLCSDVSHFFPFVCKEGLYRCANAAFGVLWFR